MAKTLNINIYTDGACSGNPGPGGWGALLFINKNEDVSSNHSRIILKGGEMNTTNNRMELIAVIEAFKFIYKNFKDYIPIVHVVSDSSYVVNPINQGWLDKWRINGWKTTSGESVKNKDLWIDLYKIKPIKVTFERVKGHNGHEYNEYVDKVAVKESMKYKRLNSKF